MRGDCNCKVIVLLRFSRLKSAKCACSGSSHVHVFDCESLTHCETFQKNVKEMMDANGVRVLVDLLTLAHLHTTRATVPLQVGAGVG